MLIRFIAKNFLSFNEATEFNMLTGDVRRLPDHVYKFPKVELLKSAVIYGANGAGKSNLIDAIEFLKNIVLQGEINPVASTCFFRMADNEKVPSSLEIEFMMDGIGYAYGIIFFENKIQEEWLYLLNYGKKDEEIIFERKVSKAGKENLKFAEKYQKSQKDKLLIQVFEEDLLQNNKTFISLVKDKKFKEINSLYEWFKSNLVVILPKTTFSGLVKLFNEDHDFKNFTNLLLNSFQTGIDEIDIQTIGFSQYFGEDNPSEKERILRKIVYGDHVFVGEGKNAIAMVENGEPVVKKAVAYHKNTNGDMIKFELEEESDGTLRLIDFIPLLYVINKYPVTVIIDEIDQSIHPALLKEFIHKIQDNKEKLGQIIFTTHESNLLDQELFRQDEIWFAEKNKEGASEFYPLSDYEVRSDLDIRKGYLSGRFGSIPFLANLKDLKWEGYG